MTQLGEVAAGLRAAGVPDLLVSELVDTFTETKRRYFSGDLRPTAVEGGRFTEAAARICQWLATGTFTPLGDSRFKFDDVEKQLKQVPRADAHESVRLHIPRVLRVIYDVRNTRDTAHLRDGIDPNTQDASLVIRNVEWVMAEFVRLCHNVTPDRAQQMIEDLVSREVPAIQLIRGFPVMLRELRTSDHALVLLYWRGAAGATLNEIKSWVPDSMKRNMQRTLHRLAELRYCHLDVPSLTYVITVNGEREVEERALVAPV